jgi:hypothetical protein
MRLNLRFALAASLALSLVACKKTADTKPNFESGINAYYQAHPSCLWSSAQQFPVQVGHSDPKTTRYDALVDQGLLVRTTSEKKIIIISKQENNYDISDKGRTVWTTNPSQPGYGNFCYGHRKVSTIDSSTPTTDQPGATTTVQYHYTFADVPAWATAAETQTAFPELGQHLSSTLQPATAQMTNTTNGWQVSSATKTNDGTVVQ